MKYGYVNKIESAKEFQEHILLFNQKGGALENIVINLDFDSFLTSLVEVDTVVICSYVGLFASIGSYLTTAIDLMERGITMESLHEPNIHIDSTNSDFARQLNELNYRLRSSSSQKSMTKSKSEGKKIGRPRGSSPELKRKVAQVERLCKESKISVAAACKRTNCNMEDILSPQEHIKSRRHKLRNCFKAG